MPPSDSSTVPFEWQERPLTALNPDPVSPPTPVPTPSLQYPSDNENPWDPDQETAVDTSVPGTPGEDLEDQVYIAGSRYPSEETLERLAVLAQQPFPFPFPYIDEDFFTEEEDPADA